MLKRFFPLIFTPKKKKKKGIEKLVSIDSKAHCWTVSLLSSSEVKDLIDV